MFLKADLGWLPGFPMGSGNGIVHWMSIPSGGDQQPQQVELDRHHLRRATYTWSKLVYRFPRVLPRLVEDAEWWKQGITNVFAWLKDAIHQDKPIPVSLLDQENLYPRHAIQSARRLVEQHPGLRAFVHALSWVHYLSPGDLTKALSWAQGNAGTIELLGNLLEETDKLVDPFVLWELSRRDQKRQVQPLIDFLGDRRAYTCPTRGEEQFISQIRSIVKQHRKSGEVGELPVRPAAELGHYLWRFSRWLIQKDRGTRRRALDLFGLVLPPSLFDPWERWWSRGEVLVQRARKLLALRPCEITKSQVRQVNRAIDQLVKTIPPRVNIDPVIDSIQYASHPDRQSFHKALVASLRLLPEKKSCSLIRAAFLAYWVHLEVQYGQALLPFLREFQKYQQAAVEDERLFGPWRYVVEPWEKRRTSRWWGLAEYMLDEIKDRSQWKTAFKAMALCAKACKGPLGPGDGDWVCTLACFSSSAEQVCLRFLALRKAKHKETHLDEDLTSCADRLSENADDFASLYRILDKSEIVNWREPPLLIRLHDSLERAGWTGLLRAVILDRKVKDVVDILRLANARAAVSQQVHPPSALENPALPEWAKKYPQDVHHALTVLNSVAPDAEARAGRILKNMFLDAGRIEDEIRALQKQIRARPDDDRLKVRLHHLEQRRAEPGSPRKSRVQKAVQRIERAIRSAVLATWKANLECELTGALDSLLATEGDVSCLLTTQHLQAFSAALELGGGMKRLALDLYRLRCGPPPWHLHDHPANQSFIEKMKRQGVDTAPWLEFPEPWERTAKNGERLTVYFEEDPLEIFQMGAYFNTCLSPGDCNFFSVFSNAADVNKKVLFARDERGLVVGRCLFALSDNGGILVFHPYCHNRRVGFQDHVKSVAADLASRMGTVVIPRGAVSDLVSSDWYDDGPLDLCERFACLKNGSAFRKALQSVELPSLRNLVEGAFDPMPVNTLSLSLLLDLPEFDERPELVLPLLSDIERTEGFTAELWHRVISRSHRAGAIQVARRMIQRRLVPAVLGQYRQHEWLNTAVVQTIAEIDPSTAIRLVRKTRTRGVRSDEEEADEQRRRILGTAYRILGREKKAAAFLPADLPTMAAPFPD